MFQGIYKPLYHTVLRTTLWVAPALLPMSASAQEPTRPMQSTAADRQEIAITVYNQNFGLVREVLDR